MKKLFLTLYEDISYDTHYCCSGCHSPFSDRDATCPNGCDSAPAEFLTISVGAQLKRKLERKFQIVSTQLCVRFTFLRSYFLGSPTTEISKRGRRCS